MKTWITLSNCHEEELPAPFQHDDVRFPGALVDYFLERYTEPGHVVLDPFAGYGTALIAAEAAGRKGYGIEIDPVRVEYARSRLHEADRMLFGDSRQIAEISPLASIW